MEFIVGFLLFTQSGESAYDTPRLEFIDDIYNTINEHNQRQTRYLSFVPNYFDI